MKNLTAVFAALTIVLAMPSLAAEAPEAPGQQLPRTPLLEVLDELSKRSDLKFVMDQRVDQSVVLGQLKLKDIDYPSLLVILRNNRLAAVKVENLINIVPVSTVRQHALPVIHGPPGAASRPLADEEWVTLVLKIQNATPSQFVPIMRPLLPKEGHMAAQPESGTLIIVDRYANARRVAGMIAEMDAKAGQ